MTNILTYVLLLVCLSWGSYYMYNTTVKPIGHSIMYCNYVLHKQMTLTVHEQCRDHKCIPLHGMTTHLQDSVCQLYYLHNCLFHQQKFPPGMNPSVIPPMYYSANDSTSPPLVQFLGTRNVLYMIIRSTKTSAEAAVDFDMAQRDHYILGANHSGFLSVFDEVLSHIYQHLDTLQTFHTIVMFGHSLGASVGILLYLYLTSKTSVWTCDRIACINSAAPKVLSLQSHDRLESQVRPQDIIINIINMPDVIPALALSSTDYLSTKHTYHYKQWIKNVILLNEVYSNYTLRDCHTTSAYTKGLQQFDWDTYTYDTHLSIDPVV